MNRPPLYLIDYPEAETAMRFLSDKHGIQEAGRFKNLGGLPNTSSVKPHQVPSEPFIVMNGSGNFHHESYALYEGFVQAHPDQQFVYIQIDAHPDKDDTYRWKLDCASFVGKVLEHKTVDQLYLLGLYPVCLDTDNDNRIFIKRLNYFRCEYFQKLFQYSVEETDVIETIFSYPPNTLEAAQGNPAVDFAKEVTMEVPNTSHLPESIRPQGEKALEVKWKTLDDFDPHALPQLPIYLTVDLDVARNGVVTDWRRDPSDEDVTNWGYGDNQGNMEFDDLLKLIRSIGAARPVWGADFCGITEEFEYMTEEAKDHTLQCIYDVYSALADVVKK